MTMIKRGKVKGGIVGTLDSKKVAKNDAEICCSKCKRCFKTKSEAASCTEENCPLK